MTIYGRSEEQVSRCVECDVAEPESLTSLGGSAPGVFDGILSWKGQSNFPLQGFIAQHRNAFISMQQCAEHIAYQLPNEHTRVGYLLEGIQCPHLGLQAAMASM